MSNKPLLFKMAVKIEPQCSFGVASARHVSGLVVKDEDSPYLFDAPLGPSVVRWDLRNGERLQQFQAHRDLIVCMRLSPNSKYIATTSSGGEIKLWTRKWKLLNTAIAPVKSLFHLSWSKDSNRILIISNGIKSSAMMYSVSDLKCLWQIQSGLFPLRDPSSTTKQLSHDVSHDKHKTGDLYYMGEINSNGTSVIVEERDDACTMIHLCSSNGELVRSLRLESLDGKREVHTHMISSGNNGYYVIMAQGGYALVIKGEELEVSKTIHIGYTSRACVWDNNLIILPSDSGKLVWVDIKTGEQVHEYKIVSSDFVVHIDWSENSDALFVCGFSKLSYCPVTRNEKGLITGVSSKFSISTHEISCCGAGFSLDSTHLAVGDLAGNVYLYQCNSSDYHPIEEWNVGGSVRCIEWIDNDQVLIGCLDGLVHLWKIGIGIKVYFALESSVLHIRLSNNNKCFAVGSSNGKVGIFSLANNTANDHEMGGAYGNLVCPVSMFVAHKPQPDNHDDRFGQLGKQAEVWSLCWSPNDCNIATCSEDQTVRVWETGSWVAMATLKGHMLAVTSVDWRNICGQSILVSCSDDRTVRIYNAADDYKLLNILDTKNIHGWHTLTYCALSPKQDVPYLLVVTQHGYIVLFNVLIGREAIVIDKMHCGSVEGLRWAEHNDVIATVGGDCAAYVWTINKQ